MRTWFLLFLLSSLSGGMFGQLDLVELRDRYNAGQISDVLEILSDPESAEFVYLKADCLHKLGDFDEAIVLYNEALKALPYNQQLILNAAICNHSAGNYLDSDKGLTAAKKLSGNSPKINYYFGANRYMEGELIQAVDYLNDALATDKEYFDAIYLLAACKAKLGEREAAAELYDQCAKLDPEMKRVNLNRANLLFDDAKYAQALDVYSRLLTCKDRDVIKEAYYFRAACRFYLHDSEGACEDWTAAAKMGDEDAREHVLTQCQGKTRKLKTRKSSYNAF